MNSEKIYLFFYHVVYTRVGKIFRQTYCPVQKKSYLILTHCGLQLKSAILLGREYGTFEVLVEWKHSNVRHISNIRKQITCFRT